MNTARRRTGSTMSDRQMGRAAVEQKKLRFHGIAPHLTRDGYLVGMDDFHWLAAVPDMGGSFVTLVHKACPLVDFLPVFLDDEEEDVQKWVEQVGRGFWEHCKKTYLGHTAAPSTQEQK